MAGICTVNYTAKIATRTSLSFLTAWTSKGTELCSRAYGIPRTGWSCCIKYWWHETQGLTRPRLATTLQRTVTYPCHGSSSPRHCAWLLGLCCVTIHNSDSVLLLSPRQPVRKKPVFLEEGVMNQRWGIKCVRSLSIISQEQTMPVFCHPLESRRVWGR